MKLDGTGSESLYVTDCSKKYSDCFVSFSTDFVVNSLQLW
jgi:hypothetical protein